jgi:hypothetical protein
MEVLLVFIGMIFLIVIIRLIAGSVDHERIDEYISERGGKVIERQWNPFGKGWFGTQNSRLYELKYVDKDGNIHQATCKTSALAGVYFTEDEIVGPVRKIKYSGRETELEEENRRLKRQIEELKRTRDL